MKKTFFIIGMLLCGLSLYAQDMKTLFIAMPDSVAPLLTKVNRGLCGLSGKQYEGGSEKPFW